MFLMLCWKDITSKEGLKHGLNFKKLYRLVNIALGFSLPPMLLIAMWPYTSYLTSARFTFFICNIGLIITALSHKLCYFQESLKEMCFVEHIEDIKNPHPKICASFEKLI
jgi:hypothetical protein